MKFISTISVFIFMTVSLFAQKQNRAEKILFIGNSFTYYNGGLEKHFMLFSASAKKEKKIIATRATKGGATLRILHKHQHMHCELRRQIACHSRDL